MVPSGAFVRWANGWIRFGLVSRYEPEEFEAGRRPSRA